MSRIILAAAACLAAIAASAASFYNSAEFYVLLSAKGTESSLIDAVFTYETEDKVKSASLACLGYESGKKYSAEDKINFVLRSRELRYSYRKDVEKARKEHSKPPKGKDNIKFQRTKGGFIPPHFEAWIKTSQGTNALESVKSVTIDFDGFLAYLIKGRDALRPGSVLHRNIGNIEKKTKGEQIDWLYRAQVCLINLAAGNMKMDRPRETKPGEKQGDGEPHIKPYRVRK